METPEANTEWRKSDAGTGHLKRSSYLLKLGIWSDVTFLVGEAKEEFKAHKLILRTGSKVFDDLFNQDPDKNIFEVPDLEPLEFSLLLKFLYNGECPENLEAGLPLLNAASTYEVSNLVRICGELLGKALTQENALKIYQQAIKYGDVVLEERAIKQICVFGYQIIKTPEFLELKIEALGKILARDDLVLHTEVQLFDALMNWGRAECKRQECPETSKYLRSLLEKVIHLIRFPQMHPTDFGLKVVPTNILLTEEVMSVLVYFSVKLAHRSFIPTGIFNSNPRAQYVPQGKELVLQRLKLDTCTFTPPFSFLPTEKRLVDLSTNSSTTFTHIPATTLEHSIRLKSNEPIWVTSIGMITTKPDHPLGRLPQETSSDDTITVQIQLKDDERKVLATKNEILSQIRSRTEAEYFIKFNSPVFLRSDDWYILSFRVTSGNFFGNIYTSINGDGRRIPFPIDDKRSVKFEFENDDNMKYTGVSQGFIPSIGFMVE